MPSSLATLLIVAFACLFMGALVGVLISSFRGDREEEGEQSEQTAPPGGRPGRYAPLVRLWREKTSETLIVELDGKSYLAPTPLSGDQRQGLEKAVSDFADWLGVMVTAADGAAPVAPAEPAKPAPSIPAPSTAAAAPAAQPPQPVPTQSPAPVETPQPQAMAAVPATRSVPSQPVTSAKEEPKSIVGQIDSILQEMLVGTTYEHQGIHLSEDPRKGVVVWIGLHHYDGIDSVPDAEIKAIIRQAVASWEKRQEMMGRP